jgi:hypothetical protein
MEQAELEHRAWIQYCEEESHWSHYEMDYHYVVSMEEEDLGLDGLCSICRQWTYGNCGCMGHYDDCD